MNKSLKIKLLLCCTYSLLVGQASTAEPKDEEAKERWFQIDVIVFQHTALNDLHAEKWKETLQSEFIKTSVDFLSPIPAFMDAEDTTETTPSKLSPETEIITESIYDSNEMQFEMPKKAELPFLPLVDDLQLLVDQLTSIKRSRQYKLLRQLSWRQPVFGPDDSVAVRLIGGNDFSEQYNIDGTSKQNPPSQQQTITGPLSSEEFISIPLEQQKSFSNNEIFSISDEDDFLFDFEFANKQPDYYEFDDKPLSGLDLLADPLSHLWELDGTIEISLRRYLHVNLQLEVRRPEEKTISIEGYGNFVTEDANDELEDNQGFGLNWNTEESSTDFSLPISNNSESVSVKYLQPYTLTQKRRVRSKEVHYFDHPLIGVLVLITPYQNKIEEEQEDTSTAGK